MKKINEVQVWSKRKLARDHRLAVIMMVQQQIDIVGDLMSRHTELVKSPTSYNVCAGLIDQLKVHAWPRSTRAPVPRRKRSPAIWFRTSGFPTTSSGCERAMKTKAPRPSENT